ncbi:phosphoserine phosphatase [Methanohalophilus sp.]|uniref:coiled-coil protein n=1 Tax=Methanohalophilus sp. TaxID=1966352 RepID=UPI00260283AC|nr:phosphoserine phosphatase [Methanohalophilus sp.]MDK2891978.1 hypothetical protein [Methanohalophilus sp.]
MKDPASMTERELKETVNKFRNEIAHNEKILKNVFRELKLHRTNISELKEKRDELNAKVRELAALARKEKEARDKVNARISEIKGKRQVVLKQKDKLTGDISSFKEKRDRYNQESKGSVESLAKAYTKEVETFLNADIPLKHEKDVFERIIQLEKRLEAALIADGLHKEVMSVYDSAKEVEKQGYELGNHIKELAEESQKYHLKMIDLYNQIDEIRKEADLCHSQMKETYAVLSPIRDKIDPLKKKIESLREDLGVYLDKLNEIQLEKDEMKKDEQHSAAKERLEKTGKMSLEDLKILMDKGDLKL